MTSRTHALIRGGARSKKCGMDNRPIQFSVKDTFWLPELSFFLLQTDN